MPKYLVVSTSGNPDSNSRRMGRVAFAHLQRRKIDCTWIDISEMDLPLCDADKCYLNANAQKLNKAVETADGILCSAGGTSSYMAVMAYANSLMLDFRTVIIPRFVYATGDAFKGDEIIDKKVLTRIEQAADELVRFTQALR